MQSYVERDEKHICLSWRRGELSYMQKDRFLPAEMQCWIWMCWFTRELVTEIDMKLLTGMSWRTFKECYKENECVSVPCSPGMFTLLMAESVSHLLHEEGWQCCIRTDVWIFISSLNFFVLLILFLFKLLCLQDLIYNVSCSYSEPIFLAF